MTVLEALQAHPGTIHTGDCLEVMAGFPENSVVSFLDREYEGTLGFIDELKATIERTEKALDRDRLHLAELAPVGL